jgi:predicted nucleic acid-binding protein
LTQLIVLDTDVLGLLTHPNTSDQSQRCNDWFSSLVSEGVHFVLPEIADYELRREALRIKSTKTIRRLDALKGLIRYEPISTQAMLEAARLWAWVRNQGQPTADPKALDGDVILAGQIAQLAPLADEIVIATTNVRHLSLFGSARLWENITVT